MKVSSKFLELKCKHRTKKTCDNFFIKKIFWKFYLLDPWETILKGQKTRDMKYKIEFQKRPFMKQIKSVSKLCHK